MSIERFKTKASLGKYIKELLKNTEPGDFLSQEDKQLLHELIEGHPCAAEKIGSSSIFWVLGPKNGIWRRGDEQTKRGERAARV
jgi:hypothetical protein